MRRFLFVAALTIPAGQAHAAPGGDFQVTRYTVSLKPDAVNGAIAGTETITIVATADGLSRLAFSPNALHVDAAAAGEVSSDKTAIVFALPHVLAKGETFTLHLRLDGKPARGVATSGGGLYTSYFACDWMVCLQDAPDDKADFALDLVVPAGWTTVGVGRELAVQTLAHGLVRHRWRATRPYSAYLYGFAAGPYPRQTIGAFTYVNATGMAANLPQAFEGTPATAAFLAGKAGLPLPDGRYTQILVPDDEAQEAAGFSLIGRASLERDRTDPASAWLVAHEMTHQWWGNLVTCATWRDLWLDEGVTTFLTAAWQQHVHGDDAYRAMLDKARARAERARAAGYDKPLAWDGQYPSLGMRRAIQYSKAAVFLATLRDEIGDDAFWKGLRLFTQTHAGGTVTSQNFQAAMETASGKDLSAMFRAWVYGNS